MRRTPLNLNQNTYTNKDFNQVYPELLELAKELSYKWDPTVSNESDPGVVLIKELALAIDKINYNTDKSALEQLPSTVQQPEIANELFRLLGYYPSQYKSAKEKILIQYKGEPIANDAVIIPEFTMVQDEAKEMVYTITEQVNISTSGINSATVEALEGIITTLDVNGNQVITEDMLDDNNRIYLRDYSVAQNGIFIRANGDAEYSGLWNRVDNLELQNQDGSDEEKYCFSFGVDSLTNNLYIEFPEWISNIIGGGLTIKYILSNGTQGIAPLGYITRFCNVSSFNTAGGQTVQASTENFDIQNNSLEAYGSDPETIDEMYRGYKKTCGTFNTLVTLRDYENAVFRSPEVSNDKVCDRTNDIQLSYKVQNESEKYAVSSSILPYELKIYSFQRVNKVNDKINYDFTFTMPESSSLSDIPMTQIIEELEDYKMMNVDFKEIEKNKMCLFTNVFDLKGQIYTNSYLTDSQKEEVQTNIQKALYENYNSRMLDFGEQISRDKILTTINSADKRIISSYLDEMNYQTYVQYYDTDGVRKTICISDECSDYIKVTDIDDTDVTLEDGTEKTASDFTIGTMLMKVGNEHIYVVSRETSLSTPTFVEYSDKRSEFRTEIFARAVLNGNTSFFVRDENDFNYYTGQETNAIEKNVEKITTNTTFDIPLTEDITNREIPKNTTLQFSREKLYDITSYSMYVKYEFISPYKNMIQVNEDYKLSDDEYIIFVFKNDDGTTYYKAVVYGKGSIISPDFLITRKYSQKNDSRIFPIASITEYPYEYRIDDSNVAISSMDSISGTNRIKIKGYNQYVLDNTNLVYVISNTVENEKYVMTIPSDGYVLKTGEFFFYTDRQKSYLNYVGEGTMIRNNSASSVVIQNKAVDTLNISLLGIKAFKNDDFTTLSSGLTLVEQEFINLPEGTKISTNLQMLLNDGSLNITSESVEYSSDTEQRAEVIPLTNSVVISSSQDVDLLYDLITDIYKDTLDYTHYGSVTLTSLKYDFGTETTPNIQNVWKLINLEGNTIYLADDETPTSPTTESLRDYVNYHNFIDASGLEYFKPDEVIKISYSALNVGDNSNLSIINKISYTLPSGETGDIIPGQQSWDLRAFLGIRCDKDNPQYIDENQSITINGTEYSEVFVETLNNINTYGGADIPVYTLDDMLNKVYQTMRIYESENTKPSDDMDSIFTLAGAYGVNSSKDFTLPIGQHILRIEHKIQDLSTLTITDGNNVAYTDCNSGVSNFKNPGIYYIKIDNAVTTAQKLKVTYNKTSTDTEYVTFSPIIKVSENSALTTAIKQ